MPLRKTIKYVTEFMNSCAKEQREASTVRKYRPEDRSAVRAICYETGLLGDPIDPYFGCLELFADFWTTYYTDYEPESCFAAEADGKGLDVGFRGDLLIQSGHAEASLVVEPLHLDLDAGLFVADVGDGDFVALDLERELFVRGLLRLRGFLGFPNDIVVRSAFVVDDDVKGGLMEADGDNLYTVVECQRNQVDSRAD